MKNSNQQSLKTIGLVVYSILLILIFLYPPVKSERIFYNNSIIDFQGWDFIFNLGNNYQIHVTYLLIEILIIVLHVSYFAKKITIKKIIVIIFIYIIYLSNFSGFDHQSYINFPIIVFCFFHGLSLHFQKNNYASTLSTALLYISHAQ